MIKQNNSIFGEYFFAIKAKLKHSKVFKLLQ